MQKYRIQKFLIDPPLEQHVGGSLMPQGDLGSKNGLKKYS
jgi:hypothetical protein